MSDNSIVLKLAVGGGESGAAAGNGVFLGKGEQELLFLHFL